MKEIFKKLGISDNTINQMVEICSDIENLSNDDINEKIDVLKKVGCDTIQIKNIISSNPEYLDRFTLDVNNLIKTLEKYGFNSLNMLFDGNPYILNLDDFEIEEYIGKRLKQGEILEDIVDEMDSNPYLFEEI